MTTTATLPRPLEPPAEVAPNGNEPPRWRWSINRRWNLGALALYGILGLIANLPMYPGDPSRIATCACGGNEDLNQTAWFLAWTPYAILHGHNPFVSNWINFPSGVDIAQNTGMQLLGIVTAPLTLLVSPVASENLLRWLAFPLSAYAMYFVLRRFVSWAPAAVLGGLLYGFSPYMVNQGAVHLNLTFVPLPPLIIYCLYELIVAQRHSAWRFGLAAGVLAVAQFFISAEVLATTGLIAGIALFVLFFSCIREVPTRWRHALIGLSCAAVVVAAGVAYPLWMMMHAPSHYVGPAQGFNQVYNADLLGAILPTSAQLVAPHRIAEKGNALVGGLANVDENGSYLGFPLLLILGYFVFRYWRRLWVIFAALMVLIAYVFSLGPYLYVDGKFHHLPVNLPFRKINHLPFLENILPARISLYVVMFSAIILAIGLDAYREDVRKRRARGKPGPMVTASRVLAAVVGIAAVVALIPRWPYQTIRATPHYAESPAGLDAIPAGSALLTYPYVTPFTDEAMLWQALSGMRFKVFGAYALNPDSKGAATTFPAALAPDDIEPLLANALTPVPVSGVPDIAATQATIAATTVVAPRRGVRLPPLGKPVFSGMVVNVDRKAGTFLMSTAAHASVIEITTGRHTRFVEPWTKRPSLSGVVGGEKIDIYGQSGPGSLTNKTVVDLRTFIRLHHVDAVLVEFGRRDSALIASWVTRALGPASRAGGGGELWLGLSGHHLS